MLSSAWRRPGRHAVPASSAASRATRSHMSSGSGAGSLAMPTSKGCQVRRATPMMQVARGSAAPIGGRASGQARDLPGMAMARSAMMFFWISVEPPPMVE